MCGHSHNCRSSSPNSSQDIRIKNTFVSITEAEPVSSGRHTIACVRSCVSDLETQDTIYSPTAGSVEAVQPAKPDYSHRCGFAKGNHLHASGKCRPCVFITRAVGCANGADCDHCHEFHSRKFILEKKKANKIKKIQQGHSNRKWHNTPYVAPHM